MRISTLVFYAAGLLVFLFVSVYFIKRSRKQRAVRSSFAHESRALRPPEPLGASSARILSTRDENAAEIAARLALSWRVGSLGALLPGVALIGFAAYGPLSVADSSVYSRWIFLAPGLVFLLLALWLFWRPRKNPEKIMRVQGTLTEVEAAPAPDSDPASEPLKRGPLWLGEKYPVRLPRQWEKWIPISPETHVCLEICDSDCRVVSFGKPFSLEREASFRRASNWRAPLLWALTGAALLVFIWRSGAPLSQDFAYAKAVLAGPPIPLFNAPEDLLARLPEIGRVISIHAQVRCQIADRTASLGSYPMPITCQDARWGGAPLSIRGVLSDEALHELFSGEIVVVDDSALTEQQMYLESTTDPESQQPNPLLSILRDSMRIEVSELGTLVKEVDHQCQNAGPEIATDCAQIKEMLTTNFVPDELRKKDMDWESRVQHAKRGHLEVVDDAVLVTQSEIGSLRYHLRNVAAAGFRAYYKSALNAALASQRGGIVLREIPEAFGLYAHNNGDWPLQWEQYQILARPESLQKIEITGRVANLEKDKQGDQTLQLVPLLTEPPFFVWLRLGTFLLGTLLLGGQGLGALVNLYRTRSRYAALDALYASESGRGS